MFVVHNLTQRTEVFPKFAVHGPVGLVRNHFFVLLPKTQQVDMVQPFDHFRSLKCQSPGYLILWTPFRIPSLRNQKIRHLNYSPAHFGQ